MKKITRCLLISVFTILMTLAFMNINSYGTTGTKYLSLYLKSGQSSRNGRPSGFYTSGQSSENNKIPIIKIIEVNGTGSSATQKNGTENEVIYCLKNNLGFGTGDGSSSVSTAVTYSNYFNMRNYSSIGDTFNKVLPTNTNYNKLMWLLDNICIPENENSVNELLTKAEADYTKSEIIDAIKEANSLSDNNKAEEYFKDIIEAIQQTAIWYITGGKKPSQNLTIYVANSNGETGTSIESKYFSREMENPLRALYDYLITEPDNQTRYNYEQAGSKFVFTKNATVAYTDTYVRIGPYKLEATNYSNFNARIYNGSSEITNASNLKIVKENGSEYTGSTTKDKIESTIGNNFYLQLPSGTSGSIKIEVSANTNERTLTYWTTNANTTQTQQPVVVIDTNSKSLSAQDTQTIQPQTTSIKVKKVWSDANNQDNKRTSSITVELVKNGSPTGNTATLNAANDWAYTFSNLAKYENGSVIAYTVKETNTPAGYTAAVSGSASTEFTITNSYTPEKTQVRVNKVWQNDGAPGATKPDSITVELLKDGESFSPQKTLELRESNNWSGEFTGLDKYKNVGQLIVYTIKETNVPDGYTSTVTGSAADGFTITNKFTPEKTQVSVHKVWSDANNQDGTRPDSVTVELLKNGQSFQPKKTVELNNNNGWSGKFSDLDKYDSGNSLISYTVQETSTPSGYTVSTSGNAETGYTITNSHTPEKTHVPVHKEWSDANNQDGKRTDSVTVELLKNGQSFEPKKTLVLNSGNGWSGDFTNLDKYESKDNLISYTVQETNTPSGYKVSISGNAEDGYTITNSYTPEKTHVPVHKVWNDAGAQGVKKPTSITVELLKDGQSFEPKKTLELNASNGWSVDFTGLDKYEAVKRLINYSVKEIEVPSNYTSSMTGNAESGYTITNTVKPFDLSLRKFITAVNDTELKTGDVYDRAPVVDTSPLLQGKTTANYFHTKEPVKLSVNDVVTYTIRVYNEAEIDGYAEEITDHLPPELEFLPQDSVNRQYLWTVDNSDSTGRTIKTNYLSQSNGGTGNLLKGFKGSGTLAYKDIKVRCRVRPTAPSLKKFTNIAEITQSKNEYNIPDRDNKATANLPSDANLPNYKGNDGNDDDLSQKNYYYEGQEDDDDFEKVFVERFDLALRKFITQIAGKNVTPSRAPDITQDSLKALAEGSSAAFDGTTAHKNHNKNVLSVNTGDNVVYTIRIYNEGDIDGYAEEITDYLPDGLQLVPKSQSQINTTYEWEEDSNNSQIIRTKYLSKQKDASGNLIKAFNKNPTSGTYTISYKDVQVECKVVANPQTTDTKLKNVAEITDDSNNDNVSDRDSEPDNIGDHKNNYGPSTAEQGKGYEDDDDYEDLVLPGTFFDLALRKFITAINDTELKIGDVYDRAPVVDTSPLLNGKTTANYKHTKEPISVSVNDIITYTIRVYNEARVDGYAEEITDHLPPELEFLPNDPINKQYLWSVDNSDSTGRTIKTNYLSQSRDGTGNLLKGFSGEGTLDYRDIKVRCRVRPTAPSLKRLTNIAEITQSKNEYDIPDRDNEEKAKLPTDDKLPDYKGKNSNDDDLSQKDYYYEGQEDDDDFEKLFVERFDLALRKFITGVNDDAIDSRIPQVDASKYGTVVDGKEITDMEYKHTKDPVRVANNDIVIYTIRIYNEGTKSGYASEIKDDIPDGLQYIPDNEINEKYGWVMYDEAGNITTDVSKAVSIRTNYLSKDNESEPGEFLLKAYDAETMDGPDYKDVQIAFLVTEPNTSDRILTNHAEISDDTDENGKPVEDIDSTPDDWKEDDDDQDVEHVYVKYFDLALRKWVSQVILIEDGVQKEMDTGHYAEQDPEPAVKVELNKKRIENTIVKFRYQIRITNEGEIEGYATEISDYIPDGLMFNQADNPKWREEDNKIVTDQLKDTLLQPGESATVEVVLTWINGEDNLNLKTNVAEISEDDNPSDSPDIDSTPNNKKPQEDDIDDAPVILTIVTGLSPTYIALIAGTIFIIGAGAFVIKKYVV